MQVQKLFTNWPFLFVSTLKNPLCLHVMHVMHIRAKCKCITNLERFVRAYFALVSTGTCTYVHHKSPLWASLKKCLFCSCTCTYVHRYKSKICKCITKFENFVSLCSKQVRAFTHKGQKFAFPLLARTSTNQRFALSVAIQTF